MDFFFSLKRKVAPRIRNFWNRLVRNITPFNVEGYLKIVGSFPNGQESAAWKKELYSKITFEVILYSERIQLCINYF